MVTDIQAQYFMTSILCIPGIIFSFVIHLLCRKCHEYILIRVCDYKMLSVFVCIRTVLRSSLKAHMHQSVAHFDYFFCHFSEGKIIYILYMQ